MILQALANYYEYLAKEHPERVARPGWCSRQVAFMLELSSEGELTTIIPSDEKRGWSRVVPEQAKRTVGIDANLLCDNAAYLLGIDAKGKPERARQCFDAAKERHCAFLGGVDSLLARAVCKFFESWDPSTAVDHPAVVAAGEALLAGGNLVFRVAGKEVLSDEGVCKAWDEAYGQPSVDATVMTCLVSGESAPIARLHPSIKGVVGAQAMGASLVGFNARAFESYGHDEEQGLNAPVSEQVTFAYATALNYLLSDRKHHLRLGDTTVVYWAAENDDVCTQLINDVFNPQVAESNDTASGATSDPDQLIDDIMCKVSAGLPVADVDPATEFFVLGLAPNAARLSVRFFQHNTFGATLDNIRKHYECINIVRAPFERKYLSPYLLLKETENPNAKQPAATSILAGALMRSILDNQPYPKTLFTNALLRTRATQDNDERHARKVTRGRAAIMKAYLLRNCAKSDEEVTVELNEERTDAPYLLGRLFSVYENIQEVASPGLNATIKDKFFDAACTTPSLIFSTLEKMGNHHLKKLSRDNKGYSVTLDRLRQSLICQIVFPKALSPEDQCEFILGYYHQNQKRYAKKEIIENNDQSNVDTHDTVQDQEA